MNICNECDSRWIEINNKLSYQDITLEECFVLYHKDKYCCQCDADKKLVIVMEE